MTLKLDHKAYEHRRDSVPYQTQVVLNPKHYAKFVALTDHFGCSKRECIRRLIDEAYAHRDLALDPALLDPNYNEPD